MSKKQLQKRGGGIRLYMRNTIINLTLSHPDIHNVKQHKFGHQNRLSSPVLSSMFGKLLKYS